jgi:hypothetical protein
MQTIAILTDFGLDDNFVGVMKGVIIKINPRVRIVDISHNIAFHDIAQAAFLLRTSYKYFPSQTIFLVVVDPGVGSKRAAIIVRSKNYFFVGPDNGVLSLAAYADGIRKVVKIKNERYYLKPYSNTFHGRDIFAPTAAYLAKGVSIDSFGSKLNSITKIDISLPKIRKNILQGKIIYIDRFGNLITNITEELFKHFTKDKQFIIKINKENIKSIVNSYQAVEPAKPLAIFGSFGFLEISLNKGNAKKYFRAKRNLAIDIQLI